VRKSTSFRFDETAAIERANTSKATGGDGSVMKRKSRRLRRSGG
jgi:hypothetical protein